MCCFQLVILCEARLVYLCIFIFSCEKIAKLPACVIVLISHISYNGTFLCTVDGIDVVLSSYSSDDDSVLVPLIHRVATSEVSVILSFYIYSFFISG